ncbi:MAG: M56 family metallopeptidase [Acidimicrobiales bacterium]
MLTVLVPLVVAVVAALCLSAVSARLPGRRAARLLVASVVAIGVVAWAAAWSLAVAYLAHVEWATGVIRWCRISLGAGAHALGTHASPPSLLGMLSMLVGTLISAQFVVVGLRWHRSKGAHDDEVRVVEDDRPVAFAEPGARGSVVVTTGLLATLPPPERRAVLAHELSHRRNRHDRYLVIAAVAAAIPGLGPVGGALRTALERWADEDAARQVGNPEIVAAAIARLALGPGSSEAAPLAATGGDVAARVASLLGGHPAQPTVTAGGLALSALVGVASLVQLHHLVAVVATLCHH